MTTSNSDKATQSPNDPLTYKAAGVDITAGDEMVDRIKPAIAKTHRPGVMGSIGGFGGLFDLAKSGYSDPILVGATDGVGTKLKIAIDHQKVDTVGIDLVAMCVNDLVVQGAEPLFFLDYYAVSKLEPKLAADVVEGIAEGCAQAGCALIGGETAEMPGLYAPGDFDLAGFAVGAVERGTILPRDDVAPGDVVIGLPSSGVHSNGFSLVRRVIEREGLAMADAAPFASDKSLGDALLEPTAIYVKPLLEAIKGVGGIKALAHITGGGLIENIPRVLPDSVGCSLDLSTMPIPPVFRWLKAKGPVEEQEMLRTFNCGVGMVVIATADKASEIVSSLTNSGVAASAVGELTGLAPNTPQVQVTGMDWGTI